MRFKVGDRVEITRMRDVNCHGWDQPQAGIKGTLQAIVTRKHYYGPYEVLDSRNCTHYCKEEDIKHLDAPEMPYDKKLSLPRDRWMTMRRWYRAVK